MVIETDHLSAYYRHLETGLTIRGSKYKPGTITLITRGLSMAIQGPMKSSPKARHAGDGPQLWASCWTMSGPSANQPPLGEPWKAIRSSRYRISCRQERRRNWSQDRVFLKLPCDSYGLLSNPPDSNIVFNNLPPNSFCLFLVFTGLWWWDQKITNLANKIGKLSPDAPEENKLYMQARLARLCAFRLAFGFLFQTSLRLNAAYNLAARMLKCRFLCAYYICIHIFYIHIYIYPVYTYVRAGAEPQPPMVSGRGAVFSCAAGASPHKDGDSDNNSINATTRTGRRTRKRSQPRRRSRRTRRRRRRRRREEEEEKEEEEDQEEEDKDVGGAGGHSAPS